MVTAHQAKGLTDAADISASNAVTKATFNSIYDTWEKSHFDKLRRDKSGPAAMRKRQETKRQDNIALFKVRLQEYLVHRKGTSTDSARIRTDFELYAPVVVTATTHCSTDT